MIDSQRLEKLKSFVQEDLRGFTGYSGKKPTLKLLRQLQDESNFKTDAKIMSILKDFDSSIQFSNSAVQDLAETGYNNLRKEDLGKSSGGAGAGGGGASLSGAPKSQPAPKLKAPSKSTPPTKAKSAYNPQSAPKMNTNKPAKPKPKPKPKPKSSGAGAGAKPKKARKPMSEAHKAKIKKGVQSYHARCKKGMALLAKQGQ